LDKQEIKKFVKKRKNKTLSALQHSFVDFSDGFKADEMELGLFP
jgi:hypothetical protein